MNKQKFVEYLRSPENLSTSQFEEIEQLLVDYPYFSIAKSVAARASKTLDTPNKNQLISSAAIYATDRKHLKKYVNGEVIFLTDTPSIAAIEEKKPSKVDPDSQPSTDSSPKVKKQEASSLPEEMKAANSDVDQILDELHRDMEALKKSRLHFAEVQNLLPEGSEMPRAPYKPVQIAKETEAKEEVPVKEEKVTKKPEAPASEDKKEPEEEATTGNITSLIDSLKKEFEEEEDEKDSSKVESKETEAKSKAVESTPVKETVEEEKVEAKAPEPELEKDEPEVEQVKSEEPKEESPKPEPPKKTKPTVVTNMDDGDEEDEEDSVLDPNDKPVGEAPAKKTSARASRGARQKVKREDLEKMMGITIKADSSKKETKEEPKEEAETEEKKPKAKSLADIRAESLAAERARQEPAKTEEKEPEGKKSEKKTTKSKKSTAKKKDEEKAEKPKAKKAPKKKEEEPKVEEPKNTEEDKPKKEEESGQPEAKAEEKPASPSQATPEDDLPSRSSARAFLDFGGTGDMSASVSRASSSRRKRKRSTNSSGDSGEKKGGDDDDKSGPKDLIDKFISENPSIQRRNLGSDKKDLSEASTQWKPEIASEYLAEIYLQQGNKQRAIEIYEALILKFPEKKSYFAALIEKVQA